MLQSLLQGGATPLASLLIFAVSAAVVWWAGSRLAAYADRFATATGLSGALVGLVLLGSITSLPEIATSATAAWSGAGALAANNLIGGVALQLLALAVVDVLVGKNALTSMAPRPDVLAYAAMNIALLVVVAGIASAGDIELFGSGVGLGAVLVVATYALCVITARALGRSDTWRPTNAGDAAPSADEPEQEAPGSVPKLSMLLLAVGGVILAAGYLLTRSGERLAEASGLGANFFGAVFLAGATSLPELSSAIAAVRLKRAQMAIGDVLGGNLFNLALLAVVDGFYRPGLVLETLGPFSVVAACLGALLCAVLIIGLVERRDRTVLRMGYDSALMLGLYAAGLLVLYSLRDTAG